MRIAKIIFASVGATAFLVASPLLALSARRYHISGQPMPNGKGGFMEFQDGYCLAVLLFVMSIGWFIAARRFWRSRLD
jgi:hypothetical protein